MGARSVAFTLIELLVTIAIIAVLASLLLPAATRAKQGAQGAFCLNNQRQLTLAWLNYAHDNDDRFLVADMGFWTNGAARTWVTGELDYEPTNRSNWDVTTDIHKSPLWPYCGNNAALFKCPGDRSSVVPSSGPFAGKRTPRVRSIAMSIWFGGFDGYLDKNQSIEDWHLPANWPAGLNSPPWRLYRRLGDMIDPGPSRTFLLLDLREDTVFASAHFQIDMEGWPDRPATAKWRWSIPGSYHNRAGALSFADGHAQLKRWVDPLTTQPLRKGKLIEPSGVRGAIPSPNNRDIIWLQERATRKVR